MACLGLICGQAAAQSQTEIFSGSFTNPQSTEFTLVVSRNGHRLTFDLRVRGGPHGMDGLPQCEPAERRPDGGFATYCSRFTPRRADSRGQLDGTLEVARLAPISFIGGAVIPLSRGPLPMR
jgi:hypothetical protein